MYKLKKQYRLFGFDYSSSGFYFITIVTANREHRFGEISNNEINYTELGKFCLENIQKFIPQCELENPFQNNPYSILKKEYIISIDDWIIMPNHIHLLIEIQTSKESDQIPIIGIGPLRKGSISSFINKFKGLITKYANEKNIEFRWQARFHDRVIRDQKEYHLIKEYIQNNVINWADDEEKN